MSKNNGLTFTVIFRANSLNYGEGTANISELKKFHRGNGDVFTFSSRQSLRYDMVRLGNQFFNWNLDVVDKAQSVVQFKADATIEDSVEMDLFGYMKTKAKSGATKRSAVARLSHAISLEPYRSDLEFLNNMGLATRINENANLATLEQHMSYYTYTMSIDLSRVGIDGEVELSNIMKAERINQLLEVTKFLNREIRGRQENLAPLFIVGGVYPIPNPFFQGRVALVGGSGREINMLPINDTLESSVFGKLIQDSSKIGYVKGTFGNEEELEVTGISGSVEEFYNYLTNKVNEFYGV